jgi:hypothetical protein
MRRPGQASTVDVHGQDTLPSGRKAGGRGGVDPRGPHRHPQGCTEGDGRLDRRGANGETDSA